MGAGTAIGIYGGVGAFESTSASKFGLLVSSTVANTALVVGNRGNGNAADFYSSRGTYNQGTNYYYNATTIGSTNNGVASQYYNSSGTFLSLGALATQSNGGQFAKYNGSGSLNSSVNACDDYSALNPAWWGGGSAVSYAYIATSSLAGSFTYVNGAAIQLATSYYAAYLFGPSGPFTGAHDALIDNNAVFEIGDLIVDIEVIAKKSISDAITKVALSSAINQKAVVGVVAQIIDNNTHVPAALSINESLPLSVDETNTNSNIHSANIVTIEINPIYTEVLLNNKIISINSLGEGLINVCGEGGDIEIGDFITTSSMPGKGMKQSDDLMHNYTAAKSREAVTFASPTEVKQIACIYHCG